jgi:hypothetical protein
MSKFNDRTNEDASGSNQKIDAIIKKELSTFFKKNMNDHRVVSRLREKYGDKNVVHAVFEAYKERSSYIERKSRKFKHLMMSHYSDRNLNQTDLVKKAKKYQEKLGLSDDEFEMFVNFLFTDKSTMQDAYSLPSTKMTKTLGYSQHMLSSGDMLNVAVDEENVVQDILRMYGETKQLHGQVVLQSLGYIELNDNIKQGEICKVKHNMFTFVHPVVAALFLPKIDLLDQQMLIANFGYLIHCKKNGLPIMTQPDVELYYNLIKDPNEHVCDSESAIKDIRNRYLLQTKLWDSVINLRQGKFYEDNVTDFLTAVDQCKSSVYDAPDLTYVKDEGAILRRLLAAFSIRPTLVATQRLWGTMASANPYNLGNDPYSAAGISHLTSVPMATLRLPMELSGKATGSDGSITLSDALEQPQWFVENNMILPKKQNIIHSRDVLIFYVGRRFKSIHVSRLDHQHGFSSLPMTVAGWEKINKRSVDFEQVYTLNETEKFVLRSVVALSEHSSGPGDSGHKLTRCVAYVSELGISMGRDEYATKLKIKDYNAEEIKANAFDNLITGWYAYDPLTSVSSGNKPLAGPTESTAYDTQIKQNGVIYVYQKIGSAERYIG